MERELINLLFGAILVFGGVVYVCNDIASRINR